MMGNGWKDWAKGWPEARETPRKFRAGPGGPECRCCRVSNKPVMKRYRRHSIRSREKEEIRNELFA